MEINKNPIHRQFLWMPIPILRSLFKTFDCTFEEQIYFFKNTSINEVQVGMLFFMEDISPNNLQNKKDQLLELVEHCDNWWISDALSNIYAKICEMESPSMVEIFTERNQSDNLWKRRQSVVSLYYYARMRKKHIAFETALWLVKNLLFDNEYYVQKGVGWTLREMYNVYPKKTSTFLEQHAHIVHPHAWQASTEKLDKDFKDKLKAKRKLWK